MKRIILFGTVLMLMCTACVSTAVPTAEEILARTIENVSKVHTARYNITEHLFYTPDDSLYTRERVYSVVECENPADTLGLSVYVKFTDKGQFRLALSPEDSFFGRVGYITKYRRSADGFSQAPFYNRAMRMCEYLLESSDSVNVKVIDRGDEWEIDACVGGKMILFSGYPRVVEFSPDNIGSHFGLRIDKSTMMPVWLSYLSNLPQSRFEESISDIELNPFDPATFSVYNYLGDQPIYEEDEEYKKDREWRDRHFAKISNSPLPTDTLTLLNGTQVSLSDDTRVKVVLFTTTQCGICHVAAPYINKIYESYPADSVQVFGVMSETVAQPQAVLDALKKIDLRVPVALNNGRFYEYFYPNGLAPAVIVVGRTGKIALIQSGFNSSNPVETDSRIRSAIDRALADSDDQ